jgi:multidrug efflux pump subunit AcrA (membrane-fusion protein)
MPNINLVVKVTIAKIGDALTLPRDALHQTAGKDYVYVVKGNGIHRRAVTIGNSNLTEFQVLSGLNVGDVVALGTTNGEPLAEGVPIRVIQ